MPQSENISALTRPETITPNNPNPISTQRYLRLLVILSAGLMIGLTMYLILRLAHLISHTLLLFALAGVVAYALDPIVEAVRGNPSNAVRPGKARRQRPRWLGVLTVFLVMIAVSGLGLFALGREAVHQGQTLSRDRAHLGQRANERVEHLDVWMHAHGVPLDLTGTIRHPPDNVRKWGESVARGSVGIATDFGRDIVEGTVVLLITAYLLLYSEELRALTIRSVPERLRPYVSAWQDDVNRIMGGFVRGQATLALVLGAAAAIACLLLGLRFWLLIGVFVVVASLIPVIGPYIGALPAIASALLTPVGAMTPGVRVVVVLMLFVAINEIGSKILYPKLVGKALGLHEVLVLFALLAGLEVGGIIGVLFAAPVTALVSVTAMQLWRIWMSEPPTDFENVEQSAGQVTEQTTAASVPPVSEPASS